MVYLFDKEVCSFELMDVVLFLGYVEFFWILRKSVGVLKMDFFIKEWFIKGDENGVFLLELLGMSNGYFLVVL